MYHHKPINKQKQDLTALVTLLNKYPDTSEMSQQSIYKYHQENWNNNNNHSFQKNDKKQQIIYPKNKSKNFEIFLKNNDLLPNFETSKIPKSNEMRILRDETILLLNERPEQVTCKYDKSSLKNSLKDIRRDIDLKNCKDNFLRYSDELEEVGEYQSDLRDMASEKLSQSTNSSRYTRIIKEELETGPVIEILD